MERDPLNQELDDTKAALAALKVEVAAYFEVLDNTDDEADSTRIREMIADVDRTAVEIRIHGTST